MEGTDNEAKAATKAYRRADQMIIPFQFTAYLLNERNSNEIAQYAWTGWFDYLGWHEYWNLVLDPMDWSYRSDKLESAHQHCRHRNLPSIQMFSPSKYTTTVYSYPRKWHRLLLRWRLSVEPSEEETINHSTSQQEVKVYGSRSGWIAQKETQISTVEQQCDTDVGTCK